MSNTSYHKYLTNQGYLIDKNSISMELVNEIKEHDLKFKPNVIKSLQPMVKTSQFTTYKESKNYLFVPRYYGINKLGMPIKNMISNGVEMSDECRLSNKFALKSHQINAYNTTIKQLDERGGGGILSVYCGWGKCLGINTPILMFDNSIKYVQNVKKNDVIVGYDGQPRKVISISNGYDNMYNIIPNNKKFKSFTCNTDHIISIIYIGSNLNGYGFNNNQMYNIPVNKIVNYPISIRKHFFLYKINSCNQIKLNLDCYLIASSMVRDDKYNTLKSNINYDIVKNITNINQIKEILNWIKFVQIRFDHFIFQTSKIKKIFNTFKQILEFNSEFNCNTTINHTEISQFDVKPTHKLEQYFGFTLDHDGRFLLGDLTVTHNTFMAINIALKYHGRTLIVVHKDILVEQWNDEIMSFTDHKAKIGLIQQNHINVDNNDFVIAMLPSLSIRNYNNDIFNDFRMLIIDECHHIGSEVFSQALPKMVFRYTLGLSATPHRKDGLTNVFTNYLGPIFHIEKRSNRNDTLVIRFKCSSHSNHYQPIYFKNGTINTMSMLMELTKFKQRNELILEIIRYIYSDADSTNLVRKTLILSKYREHLSLIYNYINDNKLSLNNHKITVGFYWGLKAEKKTKCNAIQLDPVTNRPLPCSKNSIDNENFCNNHLYMKQYASLEFNNLTKCLSNKCYNMVDNVSNIHCGKCRKTDKYDNISQKMKHKMMLEDSKLCDIILGTNDIASEALNIPGLNTLIQLTPQKDVEQSVGRILRKQLSTDSIQPLIFDIIDNCGNFIKHSQTRHKTYLSEGFRISDIIKIDLDQPLNVINWNQITQLVQSWNTTSNDNVNLDDNDDLNLDDNVNNKPIQNGTCFLL